MRQRKTSDNPRRKGKTGVLSFLLLMMLVIAIGFTATGCGGKTEDGLVSGAMTAPKPPPEIPPASTENDLLKIATEAKGTEGKICYLTFDDGPTKEVTPAVLDVLKQYDVKATFFMLGTMIEANPDIAKRVFEEGHLLANHSYSHKYKELYATEESFLAEIKKVESLIQKVTGEEPFRLMRFPGGGHDAGAYGEQKQKYKLALQREGYYFADWNALNGDAEAINVSVEQLLARIRETATQQHIVVLMHDATIKKTTPQALPAMIEYLKEQGYEFRRLDKIPYYQKSEEEKSDVINMEM